MENKNHNIRFNMEKEDECRAWKLLHSPQVQQMFKSQNKFVIEAVNDYYDRCVAKGNDPYLETREKEDAFAERIVETVEKKVISNLLALFGMYMAQMQVFSLSVPMGAYPAAQGGIVYGQALADCAGNGSAAMNGTAPKNEAAQSRDAEAGHSTEPDRGFWRELAKCNQEEFEKSGTNGKCIEARELMIALLESFINYEHDYLLKSMVDKFKKQYGVECFAAFHHNKRKTNLHIHMIFAERKRLKQLTEKVATWNMFYDE